MSQQDAQAAQALLSEVLPTIVTTLLAVDTGVDTAIERLGGVDDFVVDDDAGQQLAEARTALLRARGRAGWAVSQLEHWGQDALAAARNREGSATAPSERTSGDSAAVTPTAESLAVGFLARGLCDPPSHPQWVRALVREVGFANESSGIDRPGRIIAFDVAGGTGIEVTSVLSEEEGEDACGSGSTRLLGHQRHTQKALAKAGVDFVMSWGVRQHPSADPGDKDEREVGGYDPNRRGVRDMQQGSAVLLVSNAREFLLRKRTDAIGAGVAAGHYGDLRVPCAVGGCVVRKGDDHYAMVRLYPQNHRQGAGDVMRGLSLLDAPGIVSTVAMRFGQAPGATVDKTGRMESAVLWHHENVDATGEYVMIVAHWRAPQARAAGVPALPEGLAGDASVGLMAHLGGRWTATADAELRARFEEAVRDAKRTREEQLRAPERPMADGSGLGPLARWEEPGDAAPAPAQPGTAVTVQPAAPVVSQPTQSVQRVQAAVREAMESQREFRTKEVASARVVFGYWQEAMGKPRAIFDDRRRARIIARLRENKGDIGELCYAIDGAEKDDWLMGRDPKSNGRKYNDIETVLRDRAQVERLAEAMPGYRKGVEHPLLRTLREEAARG